MPRKGSSSRPSTVPPGSHPSSTRISKASPSPRRKASTKQPDSADDTFHEPSKGRKPKQNVSLAETMEAIVKRRAAASASDGFDQHFRMRLKHHLHVDEVAIRKHKAAVESLIMSHKGDFAFELPEDRTAWGFRASVTNDQEKYYPGFFAVYIAPEADKKASQSIKDMMELWENQNSIYITSRLNVDPASLEGTAKPTLLVGSAFDVASASEAFWRGASEATIAPKSDDTQGSSGGVECKVESSD